jgi:hypothetical protein
MNPEITDPMNLQITRCGSRFKVRLYGGDESFFIDDRDSGDLNYLAAKLSSRHPARTIQTDVWNGAGRPKIRVTTIVSPKFYTQ